MASLDELFQDYGSYHRTAGNKLCHKAGIPLIMFSLLGMLAAVEIWHRGSLRIDLAMVLVIVAGIWYVLLDRVLGVLMIVVSASMWAASLYVPLAVHLTLFIAGWIIQFIGHLRYEGRSPAFTRNLVHLLVGPLWILSDLLPRGRRVRQSRSA